MLSVPEFFYCFNAVQLRKYTESQKYDLSKIMVFTNQFHLIDRRQPELRDHRHILAIFLGFLQMPSYLYKFKFQIFLEITVV